MYRSICRVVDVPSTPTSLSGQTWGMFMTADRRNGQARPPGPHLAVQADGPYGRDGNGRSVLDCLRLITGGFGGLHGLRLIVDDLAGSELGFELVNDLRVHLLVDLDLERAQGPEGG